jgi:hypothetical protein
VERDDLIAKLKAMGSHPDAVEASPQHSAELMRAAALALEEGSDDEFFVDGTTIRCNECGGKVGCVDLAASEHRLECKR